MNLGFPGGASDKESACQCRRPKSECSMNIRAMRSIPGSRRSPGVGNGNPLQYSCLENPLDRRAWWAIVHGVAKSQTQLTECTHIRLIYN